MLKRFTAYDLDGQYTSACGDLRDAGPRLRLDMARPSGADVATAKASPAALARPAMRAKARQRQSFRLNTSAVAGLVAAACLDGLVVSFAKPALAAFVAAPVSETASLAIMLVGVGILCLATCRRHLAAAHA